MFPVCPVIAPKARPTRRDTARIDSFAIVVASLTPYTVGRCVSSLLSAPLIMLAG
ncbi:Uncharacterised protein [Mycobacteroides abscessus subsp. abscessus]|nr:Uncharacterised protein [Mycobacteroides abscessus subsp. abscessus]SKU06570.1 Uncharacterised protein [Mycobacteroides abscessus subsp. abscessus]